MSHTESNKRQAFLREIGWFIGMFLVIFAARSSLADHYYVPSGSMEHTLTAGDRVVVDKRAYGLRLPFTNTKLIDGDRVERGEIVIFDSPVNGKRLIKRIVAVGGDHLQIQDGLVAINGQFLVNSAGNERFGNRLALLNLEHGGGPDLSLQVPDGMLLAVGDHRGNSFDGRKFGLVREEEIYGKALAVYYRRGEGFDWIEL